MSGPLLSPEELAEHPGAFRLVDARPGPEGYAAGHLAGALHADLDRDLSTALTPGFDPGRAGRHPLPSPAVFAERLEAWGIDPDMPVAIYDDQGGANAAARTWWMLRALGASSVFVVDGGFRAALAAGLPVNREPPAVRSSRARWPTRWLLPTADIEDVERATTRPGDRLLIDARSRERYRGDAEPIDPVAGHIPGALSLPFSDNLGPDGRFKPAADLLALYHGVLRGTPPDRVIAHCGSGVTACHTLVAMEMAGLGGAALYVGSFSQWCRSGKPLATGDGEPTAPA